MSNKILINIGLTLDNFIKILNNYYLFKKGHNVKLIPKAVIKDKKYPHLNIYCEYYISDNKISTLLSHQDIFEALKDYANEEGYELLDFKYTGTIDKNKPVIQEVWIYTQEKSLIRRLFRK